VDAMAKEALYLRVSLKKDVETDVSPCNKALRAGGVDSKGGNLIAPLRQHMPKTVWPSLVSCDSSAQWWAPHSLHVLDMGPK